jgi:biopolymer transport protein ExbD
MAFGGFEQGAGAPMADINTTPLVDVMLVLLVIFIITAPLFNQAVPIDLPKVSATKLEETPAVLRVSLDKQGQLTLNNQPMVLAEFEQHCRISAQGSSNSELHLRADRDTRYEQVAEVMAAAQRGGVIKIAFVTEPAK